MVTLDRETCLLISVLLGLTHPEPQDIQERFPALARGIADFAGPHLQRGSVGVEALRQESRRTANELIHRIGVALEEDANRPPPLADEALDDLERQCQDAPDSTLALIIARVRAAETRVAELEAARGAETVH